LNELSVEPMEGTSADERMLALVGTLKALRTLGAARVLRSTQDVLERYVAADTSMRAWLFSRHDHREEKQLLKSALNKSPFVEALHARAEAAADRLVDVRHRERPAKGLGAALLLRSAAVSLVGGPDFAFTNLPVSRAVLNDAGEIQTTTDHVLNVWNEGSVEQCRSQITACVLSTVANGELAWGRRDELFSHLEWSREAQSHLRSLLGSELVFRSVVERLMTLNQAVATWSGGPFEPPLQFSTEAGGTLQHGRLGSERECTLPSGEVKQLSLHIKLTDYWRIYFNFRQLDGESPEGRPQGRVLVGYIGKHLRLPS
jgi:hypothetical protein